MRPFSSRSASSPRMRTSSEGQGQIVDTSLMEAELQQTYWHAAIHGAGVSLVRHRSAHLLTAQYPGICRERWVDPNGEFSRLFRHSAVPVQCIACTGVDKEGNTGWRKIHVDMHRVGVDLRVISQKMFRPADTHPCRHHRLG